MAPRAKPPFILLITLGILFSPPGYAAGELSYGGDFYFSWEGGDDGSGMALCGREVMPYGQNLYFLYTFYAVYSAEVDVTKSVLSGDRFILEDDAGVSCKPASAYILLDQTLFETAREYVKFVYVGDFAGECYLRAKLGEGTDARLDLGPAAADFWRMAVVTARAGTELRIAPNADAAALKKLRAGDVVYLTGRHEFYWPYPDLAWYDCVGYDEALCGDARGWLVTDDNLKRLEYVESHNGEEPPEDVNVVVKPGDFAPLFPAGAAPGASKERSNEK